MLKTILKGNRVFSIFFLITGLIMLGQIIAYPSSSDTRVVMIILVLAQFLMAYIHWSSHKGITPLMKYITFGFAIISLPILVAGFF